MKQYALLAVCFVSLMGLIGCENGNIFAWTHQPGSSSSAPALIADGQAALQNKEFTKAVGYFQRALDADPANSEAIYGYSSARLAEAGLDVGSLVSNLVRSQQTAPSNLADSLRTITYAPMNSPLLPDTITIRKDVIQSALDDVLAQLPKIPRGLADGKISPANPDTNINLAFCYILRAGLRLVDIIEFDDDYTVTIQGTEAQIRLSADLSAKDIVNAYQRLRAVALELQLSDSATISRISSDVETLFNDLKSSVNALYPGAITAVIDGDYL